MQTGGIAGAVVLAVVIAFQLIRRQYSRSQCSASDSGIQFQLSRSNGNVVAQIASPVDVASTVAVAKPSVPV